MKIVNTTTIGREPKKGKMTVYDMALNDESQQKVTKPTYIEASALYNNQQDSNSFAKNQMRNGQGKSKGGMFCTHCQMNGRIKEFCYKLVGYPPGHKLYKGRSNNGRENSGTKAVNAVTVDNQNEANESGSSKSNKSDQVSQLSSTQINQIIALLKKNECAGGENTAHMAGPCPQDQFEDW